MGTVGLRKRKVELLSELPTSLFIANAILDFVLFSKLDYVICSKVIT